MKSATVKQMLNLYAGLVGARDFDLDGLPPGKTISFDLQTETDLSRAEAIYALDTLCALNGIKAFKDKDDLLKVIPITIR